MKKNYWKYLLMIFTFFGISMIANAIITDPNTSNYVDGTETVIRKDAIDIRVFNNNAQSMPSGSIVIYDRASDNGVAVTLQSTNDVEGVPAACVTVNEISSKKQGLCRIWGYHPGIRFSPYLGTSATAGFPFYVIRFATYATSYNANRGAVTDGVTGILASPSNYNLIPLGHVLDTTSGTQNVEAFINIK